MASRTERTDLVRQGNLGSMTLWQLTTGGLQCIVLHRLQKTQVCSLEGCSQACRQGLVQDDKLGARCPLRVKVMPLVQGPASHCWHQPCGCAVVA